MTFTTRVRFLEPVDPREVWEFGKLILNPRGDYQSQIIRQHDGDYLQIAAPDQDVLAMLLVYSGNDGMMLASTGDGTPEAYVEIAFCSNHGVGVYQRDHDLWVFLIAFWKGYEGYLASLAEHNDDWQLMMPSGHRRSGLEKASEPNAQTRSATVDYTYLTL